MWLFKIRRQCVYDEDEHIYPGKSSSHIYPQKVVLDLRARRWQQSQRSSYRREAQSHLSGGPEEAHKLTKVVHFVSLHILPLP